MTDDGAPSIAIPALVSLVLVVSMSLSAPIVSSHVIGSETEAGEMRFLHASPDAPNVDIYVGSRVVRNISFGEVTRYTRLTPGTYEIYVTTAGDPDDIIVRETKEVTPGHFTAIALSENGSDSGSGIGIDVLADNNSRTKEGRARL